MAELEHELRTLGARIEFPPTPDLASAVRARLAEEVSRRRPTHRQALALVFAALAVAVAAAMAVPSARTAILRFFHIGSVTVERVETLPAARERPVVAGLRGPLTRAQAERRVGFRIMLPRLEGTRPARFYVRDGIVATLFRFEGETVMLMELPGDQVMLGKKAAGPQTRVEFVTVNGQEGLWLEGAQHVVVLQDRFGRIFEETKRLAGNVLVWRRGAVTLRIEGELTKAEALELARSVR